MLLELFSNTVEGEKTKAIESLIAHSSPRTQFFFMIMLSVAMATLGTLLNSTIVLIASMLIAPMLYPVLSLAMGLVMGDTHLASRSGVTLVKAVVVALGASTILGLLLRPSIFDGATLAAQVTNPEFLLLSAIVAIVAGIAGSYALVKTEFSEHLTGVAIAVALVPPLAAVGVGISIANFDLARGAFLLFAINIVGIVSSATVVFSLFRLSTERTVAVKATKADEKEVAKEKKEAAVEAAAEKITS